MNGQDFDDAELPKALNFTPDDLATNRTGRLSERQRDRLLRSRQRSLLIGGGLVILVIFAATGLLFAGRRNDAPILSLVGVGLTLCNAAMLGVFLRYWLRLGGDLQAGRVEVVSGRAERILRVTGRMTNYVLQVGGERLQVSRPVLKAFEHEASYHIYRTPHTRTLLSAERA